MSFQYKKSTAMHPEIPKKVYKYRNWGNGDDDRIITKTEIYFSSPKDLDATYPEAFLEIDTDLITDEEINKYALHWARILYPKVANEIHLNEIAFQLKSKMKIDDPEHRLQVDRAWKQENDSLLGIFCTTTECNDVKLWEMVGNLGKGYCVGLNVDSLLEDLKNDLTHRYVNYYDPGNAPKRRPFTYSKEERLQNRVLEIFSIPSEYAYEKEYRFARTNKNFYNDPVPYTLADRRIKLNTKTYSEVILGYDISDNDRRGVVSAIEKQIPGTPIYQMAYRDGDLTMNPLQTE